MNQRKRAMVSRIRFLTGFTLVELIVVITILAILATVGFLALSGYTQDARDSAVMSNVRSVQTAIVAESALSNNSPRYYVVHDSGAALSWAFIYVDGTQTALTGGNVGQAPFDSNYTAGNPNYARLKLNPEKFKISARFLIEKALAGYDSDYLSVGAVDVATSGMSGNKRQNSWFQVGGIIPSTGKAVVSGNFPTPSASESASWAVAWLVRNPLLSATWAMSDGVITWSAGATEAVLAVSLSTTPPPTGKVGRAYRFEMASLLAITGEETPNPSLATWTLSGGTLPTWLSISSSWVISGTPSAVVTKTLQFTATYKTKTAQQTYSISTVSPTAMAGISKLSTWANHTCAVTNAGGVKCWGGNAKGQLGNGTVVWSLLPVDVTGLSSGVVSVASGNAFNCALMNSGGVKCWGYGTLGQLGDNLKLDSSVPVDVTGLSSGVASIEVWSEYACALTTWWAVKCWGANNQGQIGNNTWTNARIPTDVVGLSSGVTGLYAGDYHVCANASGTLKCWGNNAYGQLGDGTTNSQLTPVTATGLPSSLTVSQYALWSGFGCAVTTSWGVKCWGSGTDGQLGNGNSVDSTVPVNVTWLSSWVSKVSVTGAQVCAILSTGAVKCWGNNFWGELGNGTTTNSSSPVDVTWLTSGISGVDLGGDHVCAVKSTTSEWVCWGYNASGQLGDGTVTKRTTPVSVNE